MNATLQTLVWHSASLWEAHAQFEFCQALESNALKGMAESVRHALFSKSYSLKGDVMLFLHASSIWIWIESRYWQEFRQDMNTNQFYTDYTQKNGEIRQWHALLWRLQTTLHLRSPPPTVLLSPWGAPLLCSCCHRSCAAPWFATCDVIFQKKKHLSVMHVWSFCEYTISKTACGMTDLTLLVGRELVAVDFRHSYKPTF